MLGRLSGVCDVRACVCAFYLTHLQYTIGRTSNGQTSETTFLKQQTHRGVRVQHKFHHLPRRICVRGITFGNLCHIVFGALLCCAELVHVTSDYRPHIICDCMFSTQYTREKTPICPVELISFTVFVVHVHFSVITWCIKITVHESVVLTKHSKSKLCPTSQSHGRQYIF